jgi:hypothetical protein
MTIDGEFIILRFIRICPFGQLLPERFGPSWE